MHMKMVFKIKGDFKNTVTWLTGMQSMQVDSMLNDIGDHAINVLQSNSPVDTGELRNSYYKEITKDNSGTTLSIGNNAHSDQVEGLVYLLEYGHGTGTGGYVPPTHFVQKSMESITPYITDKIEGLIENGK